MYCSRHAINRSATYIAGIGSPYELTTLLPPQEDSLAPQHHPRPLDRSTSESDLYLHQIPPAQVYLAPAHTVVRFQLRAGKRVKRGGTCA